MTQPHPTQNERRTSTRVEMDLPVKLRCGRSGRLVGGRVRNVSESGAAIDLPRGYAWDPGDRVQVAIAWAPGAVVFSNRAMAPAVVARVLTDGGVAVRFIKNAA